LEQQFQQFLIVVNKAIQLNIIKSKPHKFSFSQIERSI